MGSKSKTNTWISTKVRNENLQQSGAGSLVPVQVSRGTANVALSITDVDPALIESAENISTNALGLAGDSVYENARVSIAALQGYDALASRAIEATENLALNQTTEALDFAAAAASEAGAANKMLETVGKYGAVIVVAGVALVFLWSRKK